jgi:glycopeptide antibiotics resistance protein
VQSPKYNWGPFVFYIALLLIALLTLFPYQVLPEEATSNRQGPFWMWLFEKVPSGKDFVANILLFVPFGFALAWRLERLLGWFAALWVTVFASFLFTFSIELTQVFMPSRTSSWYDVAANTMGGTIGWLMFRVLGGYIERILSTLLTGFYGVFRARFLGGFFVAYALVAVVVTIPLNRMTILRNWDDALPLFVGNTSPNPFGWRGSVFEIAFADRYMGTVEAERVFHVGFAKVAAGNLIASYTEGAASLVPEAAGKSPTLFWTPNIPVETGQGANFAPGGPWLESNGPASSVERAIRAANQFAIYVALDTPQGLQMGWHPIVVLGRGLGKSDLVLGHYYSSLSLRMRTPLNPSADQKAQYFVGGFFFQPGMHRVLFTYDGARMNFYADGKLAGPVMELGPGAAVFRYFRRLRQLEMYGYKMIYYGLVFVPLGSAVALMRIASQRVGVGTVACGLFLPGLILEGALYTTSQRPFYFENLLLSIGLTVGSFLFVQRYLPRLVGDAGPGSL